MVKSLHIFGHSVKWLIITLLGIFAAGSLWLQTGERSLNFAKPWLLAAVNSEQAPYTVAIDKVSIDWRTLSRVGKVHISGVTFNRRDGEVFAQLPELDATVDPLGFLPHRHLLGRVTLSRPHLSLTRKLDGSFEVGIEGAREQMPVAEIIGFLSNSVSTETNTAPSHLPFHLLAVDRAELAFTDEKTGTEIVSDAASFKLEHRRGAYTTELAMPFTVDAVPVTLSASMRTVPGTREQVLVVSTKGLPSRLLCLFDLCEKGIDVDGAVDGYAAIGLNEKLQPAVFHAGMSTAHAKVSALEYFAEPLKLGASTIKVSGDIAAQEYMLDEAQLTLEDTDISASGKLHKAEEGWFVDAEAACTHLNITKLYKYWPLVMAPDSRLWVTKKLKSGYAASGKLKLKLTPQDLASDKVSDAAVDAVVDARDITFEYLPGFPLAEKMNGIAHFTGKTVKVEGGGATLMSGTKINKAVLWCPQLDSKSNPMEAELDVTAPAPDVATMLGLKYFVFDDGFGFNAKTIQGSAEASMKLKFNAFSNRPNEDPNAIHLEAVDYDIRAKLNEMAQKNLSGGYDVSALSGTLKANNKEISYEGAAQLGDSGVSDVTLGQEYGKPMQIKVKSRPKAGGGVGNDFALSYVSGEVPQIRVTGASVDGSASYATTENSLLGNFPAMKLDLDVGMVLLADGAALETVRGNLYCTKERCESADISARAGKSDLRAAITHSGGKRQFKLTASDAGAMLKALDITDRMTDGKLDITGLYNDAKTPPQLNGRLMITDFTLKNSQILGRIFAIGSLTGLQNALTGSGIAFEKMAANIGSQGGVIHIDKGVASGNSMGITFKGVVDTNTKQLNIEGVVSPAYVLNSILGSIPIIGTIAGGDEGLIAFNYGVKGTYANPEVEVNPLSGLTPGFLRGIFGGISSDTPSTKPGQEDPKKDRKPIGEKYKNNAVQSH